jgi:hypothetical protein
MNRLQIVIEIEDVGYPKFEFARKMLDVGVLDNSSYLLHRAAAGAAERGPVVPARMSVTGSGSDHK